MECTTILDRQRCHWIDSLKGIAILGVILVHCGSGGVENYPFLPLLVNLGQNGVQLFFLISAFLSYKSYEKYVVCSCGKWYTWVIKRFFTLIPLYYTAIIVFALITGGSSYWLGSEGHITFANLISHLSFTHGLFPHYADSIISVEWYLGALAIFLWCVPLLHKFIDNLEKSIVAFIIVTPLTTLFSRLTTAAVDSSGKDAYIYQNYFGNFCVVAQLPVLLLGIVFFYFVKSVDTAKVKNRRILSVCLLLSGLALIIGIKMGRFSIVGANTHTLFGISFFLIAISQYLYPVIILDNKLFGSFGKHSYPIYLFHFLLIDVYKTCLQRMLESSISDGIIGWALRYLFVVTTSLILGILADKLIAIIKERNIFQISRTTKNKC